MGSNPTLGRYFSTQVYLNGDERSGLRSLEGSVDPRACGCRGVMPRSRTVSIHDSLALQRSRWGGM